MVQIPPPSVPQPPAETEGFTDGGHVWVFAEPDGSPLGVRLTTGGRLRLAVGTREDDAFPAFRRFDAADPPSAYRFAARHIREQFDRTAVEAAIDRPERAVFRCWAVHRLRRAADHTARPVVGWTVEHPDASLLPHELSDLFEAVGLATPPVVRRELPSDRLDRVSVADDDWRLADSDSRLADGDSRLADSDSRPADSSRWVAALRYQKKGGGWARDERPTTAEPEPLDASVETVADRIVSAGTVTDDESVERQTTALIDRFVRRAFPAVTHDDTAIEVADLHSPVAQRVARRLGGR